MKISNFEKKSINPFQMKKTLNSNSNLNSASTQENTTPKKKKIHNKLIKNQNKIIKPFYEENDINSINLNQYNRKDNLKSEQMYYKNQYLNINSSKNKNLNSQIKNQNNSDYIKPSKPFCLSESKKDKASYRFLLHQASKNLINHFSYLYENNNNNSRTPSTSSVNSSNNTFNNNSFDMNSTSIFSKRKELNNLGFNLNKNIRGIGNLSLCSSKSNSNMKKHFKNKSLENSFSNNTFSFDKNNNENNLNVLFDENCFPNRKRYSISSFNNEDFLNVNNNQLFEENISILKDDVDLCDNNLEQFFILENKIKVILNKLNLNLSSFNECFEWMNYYFDSNIHKKIISIIKDSNNRRILTYIIKIELLCYCLCYNVSYHQNLKQVNNYLKNIFQQIYMNYLIILKFILQKITMSYNNFTWYEQLYNIVKNESNINLKDDELNENNIIQILNKNINQIGNNFKLIIDNIYASYYRPEKNIYKFPSSLNIKSKDKLLYQKEIIASFFYDAFSFTDSYSIDDINKFFTYYILIKKEQNSQIIFSNREKNLNIENKYIKSKNNNNNNKTPINYLPKINSSYKYTLVLDLDETLIHIERDMNSKSKRKVMILRPYLHEFLSKMKKFYELILFSVGIPDYVDPLVDIIEKKEKYFDYRLYRHHAIFDGKEYVKDLSKLGRDIRKIVIVDNLPQAFKLHRNNGICIKGFYGDKIGDRNTLKILSMVLEKIRFDADETNDIRDSLRKEKLLIITKITSNYDDYDE